MEDEEIYSNDGIECPYCGYIEDEPEIIHDQDIDEFECPSCGRKMDVSIYVSWSWTTSKRTEESINKEIECEKRNRDRMLEYPALVDRYNKKIKELEEEIEQIKEYENNKSD